MAKYKKLFSEVLLASFFLQNFGLITPLFFQVIIDKVLVHRGLTTLDVLIHWPHRDHPQINRRKTMLTLLGSLLGFLSSVFPDFLKLWRDHADCKRELAILDRQMEAQRQGHTQCLEETKFRVSEIQVQADVAESKALYAHASQPSGVKWVEALRASVRPIITYAFCILFATVKTAALFKLLDQGVGITDGLIAVWDGETQALFAAVMSFWFGGRVLAKFRSNP